MVAVNPLKEAEVRAEIESAGTKVSQPLNIKAHPDVEPILPVSLTWRDFGSMLFQLMLPQAFTLQVAHPMVNRAVGIDKKYKYDPYGRAKNSMELLWPIVYSRPERAVQMGINLRELHRQIKGVDQHGEKYHALDPEAYSWVHATGFYTTVMAHEYFATPLNDEQRALAFEEWQKMGKLLGVADKYIFKTEEEYWNHFNYIIEEKLVTDSEVMADLLNPHFLMQYPKHPYVKKWMPDFLWKGTMFFVSKINYALVAETMPKNAKERLGMKQTGLDKFIFKTIQVMTRFIYPKLPEKARYMPIAWKAIKDSREHPEAYQWKS